MKNLTKKTIRSYIQYAFTRKTSLFLMLFTIFGASALNLVGPLYYRELIDIIAGEHMVASVEEAVFSILFQLLLVYLLGWALWRTAGFTASYFHSHVMARILNDCFAYVHKHSTSFFNNTFVGSLVRRVNRYARSFEDIVDIVTWDLIPIVVNVTMIGAILAYRNIYLGIAVLVWILFFVVINYFFSTYKLKLDLQVNEHDTKVTADLADTITNHQNVKLFTGFFREVQNFKELVDTKRRLLFKSWSMDNAFEAAQTLLMIILEIGMMYLAFRLWQRNIITVGDFVLIQAYLLTVIGRFWNVGRMIRRTYEALASAEEMTEILDLPHEIVDRRNAHTLDVSQGSIVFDKVSFSYHKTRRVLSGVSLAIKPNERVAFVGPSGAGKSTLVNILLRNYDVESGKILIDDQKISDVTLESLRAAISVVSQDSILFHRSLKENIRYGRPNASDQEVIAAAKRANAHEFISEFSDGYDTLVGERGVKLSGGERQRVAIARAILKDAPILVLDEATSSLDSESEHLIQEALEELMKNKTVIVIAHRLSTIMKMDRIIVVDSGRVVEEGSHADLTTRKQSIYKSLWERQVGGFIQ